MKIIIVDDHALFREGLALLLHQLDETPTVIQAQDCQLALRLCESHGDIDFILLDLALQKAGAPPGSDVIHREENTISSSENSDSPVQEDIKNKPHPRAEGMDGLAALPVLRACFPHIPVVVVSASDDRDTVIEALNQGAMGFIPKSYSPPVLFAAMKLVLQGCVFIPPTSIIQPGYDPSREKSIQGSPETRVSLSELNLTERQRQVLALLIKGKPNKVIGRELGISEGTVKIHMRAVLKALNVTNRTQAILKLAPASLEGIGQ